MKNLIAASIALLSLTLLCPQARCEELGAAKTDTGIKNEISKESYTYTSKGRRDPFLSLITAAKLEKEKPRKGLTPLEDYDLTQISLSAIIWDKAGYFALVSLPDGKHFTIREGTAMGIHGGKVTRITDASVTIREYVKDYRGISSPQDTVLRLRREEER